MIATAGLCRYKSWVFVSYNGSEPIPIPERNYAAAGYRPLLAALPTWDEEMDTLLIDQATFERKRDQLSHEGDEA